MNRLSEIFLVITAILAWGNASSATIANNTEVSLTRFLEPAGTEELKLTLTNKTYRLSESKSGILVSQIDVKKEDVEAILTNFFSMIPKQVTQETDRNATRLLAWAAKFHGKGSQGALFNDSPGIVDDPKLVGAALYLEGAFKDLILRHYLRATNQK